MNSERYNVGPRHFMQVVCECAEVEVGFGDMHDLPTADFIQREGNLFGGALRSIIGGGRVIFAGVRSLPASIWHGDGDPLLPIHQDMICKRIAEIINAKKYVD